MGCRVGQGYHFGRPKTASEMRESLDGQRSADLISAAS
jgi:EAL domain-containing protein (putative c-di-GMP-specific phosphodiesterase class I)